MNVTATTPNDQAAPVPRAGDSPASRDTRPTGNPLPATGRNVPAERPPPPPATIERAIEQIRTYLSESRRQLSFQVDESSGRTIITVLNPASGEVIRQIPSEEVLNIAARLEAQGLRTFDALA